MAHTSRILLAAALLFTTTSAGLAESWDVIPGERDPNPIAQRPLPQLLQDRSLYEARMQVLERGQKFTTSAPVEKNYFDRASQNVDGAGGGF